MMDLKTGSFEDGNYTSYFQEHVDSTHFSNSENPFTSSFDSDCYEQNKNHKSLEDELAEIEIEFQSICSRYTFSINQISNEKLFQSNNLKSNKFDALDKNEYLNKNQEDEVDHSKDLNSDIFSTFHFDEILVNHDLNNFQFYKHC